MIALNIIVITTSIIIINSNNGGNNSHSNKNNRKDGDGHLFSAESACVLHQACLPVKDLDLGYNLVRTHDGKGAFVIVDHDEIDPVASRAPMSTVYASGCHLQHLNEDSPHTT